MFDVNHLEGNMTRAVQSPAPRGELSPEVEAAAKRLLTAARTRVPCQPVRGLIGSDDIDAAYAVQRRLTRERERERAN